MYQEAWLLCNNMVALPWEMWEWVCWVWREWPLSCSCDQRSASGGALSVQSADLLFYVVVHFKKVYIDSPWWWGGKLCFLCLFCVQSVLSSCPPYIVPKVSVSALGETPG